MQNLEALLVAVVWVNDRMSGLFLTIGFWHYTALVFVIGIYTGVALTNHHHRLLDERIKS